MVRRVPRAPTKQIEPGRDLAIIACQRRTEGASPGSRTFGVRWASRPDIGYPLIGYFVERIVEGGSPEPIGTAGGSFGLPRTGSWSQFESEIIARRPLAGPYFPAADINEDNFGYLIPLIRLIDPGTANSEHVALTAEVGEFFGNMHQDDAQLTIDFWPSGSPPSLADLLASPVMAARLIAYYRGRSYGFLLALALRFEYAVLLGLAADDVTSTPSEVMYRVSTRWQGFGGEATTDPVSTNQFCAPRAPDPFRVTRVPGSVAHPAFLDFAGWNPPAEILAIDSNGARQTAASLIPRPPAPISALEWAAPVGSGQLIDHEPVLYELKRFAHGAGTAGVITPPAPPAPGAYQPILDGELLMRPAAPPHAFDRYGMDWPPLAGYYHYQVHGVDLLGVAGPPAKTVVRQHDDLAPPAPGLKVRNEATIALAGPQSTARVDLEVVWHSAHDFVGPDATEFRFATRWQQRRTVTVQVLTVTPDPDSVLTGLATVDYIPGPVNALASLRLILPDGEYPIVAHGAGHNAQMRIRRIGGRLPAQDQDGVIVAPGDESVATRVARIPRRPTVNAFVTNVQSLDPLRFELNPAGVTVIPQQEDFPVYLHLLRATFDAVSESGGNWRIDPPPATDVRIDAWNDWLDLSDPAGLLTDSPAIGFPQHSVTVTIGPPPASFEAGLVMIDVTAADDADYVASPSMPAANPSLAGLTGNESTPASATLSVRVLTPPAAPVVAPSDPAHYIWAESAGMFVEEAFYTVRWAAVAGAEHFEVWRVLEGALAGATPATEDIALRALALAQPEVFAMRAGRVFAPRYRDRLPGRAPIRALYRVRAVSVAGVPGAWSGLVGPVHVPDVRQPPAPNFSRLVVRRPADYTAADTRRLMLEWTQAGPMEDVRFDIELKDRGGDVWRVVASKPRGTAPDPGLQRMYRHEIGDLIPGELRYFRVRAVREARDPIDVFGLLRRDIAGPPSTSRAGRAIGHLVAPVGLVGEPSAAPAVLLTWSNQDSYRSIEVLRQGPHEHHSRRIAAVTGTAEEFVDPDVATGSWRYSLRALGHSRHAESESVEVHVP